MDKKKIISSLTVAGMVATTAAGAGVFAAETDATTEFRGENTTAISGKTLSTFRLQSSTDRVTGKDLKVAYPGKTVSAADTDTFKTGDVVKIDGNYRTIVIYGDATTDGKVTISDATRVIGAIQDPTNNGLTEIQKVAADLNGDGKIKISDVTPVIAAISNETYSEMLAPSNTAKPEPVAEVSNIEIAADGKTITVKYDNDASTNEYTLMDNKAKKEVKVTSSFHTATNKATLTVDSNYNGGALKANVNGDQTYTLTVKNNGKTISEKTFSRTTLKAISTVAVDGTKMPVTNETVTAINSENVGNLALKVTTAAANDEDATVVVTLKDSAGRETTGTAKLAKDATQVVVNNFASSEVKELKDGKEKVEVTAYVIDADGNKTADKTSSITKDTDEFKIASVTATREGEKLTAIEPTYVNGAAEAGKDTDNKAVYFKVVETGTTAPTADTILSEVDVNKKYNERLSDVKLDTGKTYTVYVVSVNANGNVSNVASYDIPNIGAEALKKVTELKATDGVNGEYTWKDDDNDEKDVKAYRVTLKDGDKVISTKEVTEKKVNVLADLKSYVEDDNTLTKVTMEVVALPANADYKDSTAVSANVDLTDLRLNISTAGLTLGFDDETNHQILTWKDVANADSYVLNVYKYVKDSKGDNDVVAQDAIYTSSPISKNADKRYDLTNALSKLGVGKYAVTIKALADSDSKYVDSEESGKKSTYYLKAPTDLKATVKTESGALQAEVTLSKVDGLIGGDDKKVKYTLVYQQKTGTTYGDKYVKDLSTDPQDSDRIKDTTKDATKDATKEADSNKESTGLEADTTYKMYVKVMSDDNNELARTNEIEVKVTKQPMKVDTEYTLVDLSKQANNYLKKSQIAVSGDTLLVGKEGADAKDAPVEIKSSDDYSRYQEVIDVAKALKADDTLTLTDDSMNVTSNAKNADYKQALKNVDLTIAKDNAVIAGAFNSVKLSDDVKTAVNLTGATIAEDVDVAKAIKVDIANGTTVAIAKDVSDVTVNDVKVGTATKVTATANGLDIEGVTAAQTLTYTGDVNVNITKTQSGALTVTSENEDDVLTLSSANALTLNVKGGKVDVSALKGSTITVSDKGTLVIKGTNDNKVMAGATETTIVASSGEVKVTVGKDANSISVEGNAKITSENVKGSKKTETASGDINVEQGKEATISNDTNEKLTIKNDNGSTKYTVEKDNGNVTITSTGTTVITGTPRNS